MVAAQGMETTLKAKQNATINVFVIFLKLQGFVWVIFHHGFLILKRESARASFTEDVAVMRTDFTAKKDVRTDAELAKVGSFISVI